MPGILQGCCDPLAFISSTLTTEPAFEPLARLLWMVHRTGLPREGTALVAKGKYLAKAE